MRKLLLACVFSLLLNACGRPHPQTPEKPALPYEQAIEKELIEILTQPNNGEFVDYIQPGTYTITEEFTDENGTLWGRLQSGAGWVDLTYIRLVTNVAGPISAKYASAEGLTADHVYLYDQTQNLYQTGILLRTAETVYDISLCLLDYLKINFSNSEELFHLDVWTPEEDFYAGVIFFGDFTTFGLSYADAEGVRHYCTLSQSGRDGSHLLQEYTP